MSLRHLKIQVIHFYFAALIFHQYSVVLVCTALNTTGLGNSINTHCTSPSPHTLCVKYWIISISKYWFAFPQQTWGLLPIGNLLQISWSCPKIFSQESGRNVPVVETLHISSLFKYLNMCFTFE